MDNVEHKENIQSAEAGEEVDLLSGANNQEELEELKQDETQEANLLNMQVNQPEEIIESNPQQPESEEQKTDQQLEAKPEENTPLHTEPEVKELVLQEQEEEPQQPKDAVDEVTKDQLLKYLKEMKKENKKTKKKLEIVEKKYVAVFRECKDREKDAIELANTLNKIYLGFGGSSVTYGLKNTEEFNGIFEKLWSLKELQMQETQEKKLAKAREEERAKFNKEIEKIEEKYIAVYRENEARQKDALDLVSALNSIFSKLGGSNIEYTFKETSRFSGIFPKLWKKQETIFSEQIKSTEASFKEEIKLYEQRIQEMLNQSKQDDQKWNSKIKMLEENADKRVQETMVLEKKKMDEILLHQKNTFEDVRLSLQKEYDSQIDSLRREVTSLAELNDKLQDETNELLSILQIKDDTIVKLEEYKQEIANNHADNLLGRFDEMEGLNLERQREQSDRANEIIYLRNELENAHDQLEKLTAGKNLQKEKIEIKDAQIQADLLPNATQIIERRQKESLEKVLNAKTSTSKNIQQESEEDEKEYLKGLIVKFIISTGRGDEVQAKVIRNAIMDYLQFHSEQRASIENAIQNNNTARDNIFFYNIFKGK